MLGATTVLSDAADPSRWRWSVRTRGFWGSPHCASDLQHLFTVVQITALSISINRLDILLAARLEAPHMLSLELSLTGVDSLALSAVPSDSRYLHMRSLQHFVLNFGTTNTRAHPDEIHVALETLGHNFRQLIVYDAELLETVTVRPSARTAVVTDCASFARFARRYVELTHR